MGVREQSRAAAADPESDEKARVPLHDLNGTRESQFRDSAGIIGEAGACAFDQMWLYDERVGWLTDLSIALVACRNEIFTVIETSMWYALQGRPGYDHS